jgi:hypothetical protein
MIFPATAPANAIAMAIEENLCSYAAAFGRFAGRGPLRSLQLKAALIDAGTLRLCGLDTVRERFPQRTRCSPAPSYPSKIHHPD